MVPPWEVVARLPIPPASAAIRSFSRLAGGGELVASPWYQLLTRRLNLSPAITFSVIDGPIFCPLPMTRATLSLGIVYGSLGYPAGLSTRVPGKFAYKASSISPKYASPVNCQRTRRYSAFRCLQTAILNKMVEVYWELAIAVSQILFENRLRLHFRFHNCDIHS